MNKPREIVSRRELLTLMGVGTGVAGLGLLLPGCSEQGATDPGRDAEATGEAEPSVGDGGTAGDGEADSLCAPTTRDVEGPFFEPNAPRRTRIAADDEPGERLVISGTVFGPNCATPLVGALVDVWQADKDGEYHAPEQDYRLRGQILTDQDGYYELESIMPGQYALGDGFRPAHIHFMVSHPDHRPLTTQLYFAGDPFLPPNDACGTGCNSSAPDRVIDLVGSAPQRGTFDIILART